MSMEDVVELSSQDPDADADVVHKAPTRRRIGGPLLDSAYEDTAASFQPIMDRAKKYGATLTSDGLSDVQRRP